MIPDPALITTIKTATGAIQAARGAVGAARPVARLWWRALRAPFLWFRSRRWRCANEATVKRLSNVADAAKGYGEARKAYEARLILCNSAKSVMALTRGEPGQFVPWTLDLPLGEGGPWTTKRLCEALIARESIPAVVCNDFWPLYVSRDNERLLPEGRTDPITFEVAYTLCVCLGAQHHIPSGGRDAAS